MLNKKKKIAEVTSNKLVPFCVFNFVALLDNF